MSSLRSVLIPFVLAVFAILLCFMPVEVSAQIVAPTPNTPGQPHTTVIGPSAGTLAAAMLETVGYKAQELVLNDLGDFLTQYGILIWIIVCIAAITMFAIYGEYDGALWLLICPGLFYFLLQNTVMSSGAEWRFGNDIKNLSGSFQLSTGTNSRVSWVFDRYNRFVSNISQNLITVITDENSNTVLKRFMNRGRIFADLMSAPLTQGGVKSFLADAVTQCYQEMDSARLMSVGYRDPSFRATTEYAAAQNVFNESFSRPKEMLLNPAGKDYIIGLFDAAAANGGTFPGLKDQPNPMAICTQKSWTRVQSVGGIRNAVELPISCEELWCWMGLAVQGEVARAAEEAQNEYKLDDTTFKLMLDDLALKLQTPHTILNANGQKFQNAQVIQPDLSVIPVVIGGYLIRDVMKASATADTFGNISQHAGVVRQEYNFGLYDGKMSQENLNNEQFQDMVGKLLAEQIVEMKKFEIVTLSMILPYIQGVVLYALALTFPFFCLAVLIPGRIGALTTWMMAWAWAKSWDVGWAVVVMMDDFLWQMMPHSAVYDPSRDPSHGPESVFAAAFNSDPAYSLSNYYIILSTMVLAVPMISAQILLGAKAGVFTPLVSGIAGWTSSFSGFIRDWIGAKQQGYFNWTRELYTSKYAIDRLQEIGKMSNEEIQNSSSISEPMKEANRTYSRQIEELNRGMEMLNQGKIGDARRIADSLKITNAAAGMNVQYTAEQLRLEFHRGLKSATASYNHSLALVANYEASHSEAFFNTERIRRVLSDRGEWWNNPGAPNELVGVLYRQELARRQNVEGAIAFGTAATDPTKTAVKK